MLRMLVLAVTPVGAELWRVTTVSGVGGADRARRPARAALDAAAASWTILSEDDGASIGLRAS